METDLRFLSYELQMEFRFWSCELQNGVAILDLRVANAESLEFGIAIEVGRAQCFDKLSMTMLQRFTLTTLERSTF